MFKRQPTDTQFIIITLILVLLLGVPTFQTLIDAGKGAEESGGAELASSGPRKPASVPGKETLRVPLSSGALSYANYDLSCTKKALQGVAVRGGYVQFQGKNCLKNFKASDVEIVNKSNGYTASVFDDGSDKYQTDLIQLQNGDNEIAIRYREASGEAVEEIIHIQASKI